MLQASSVNIPPQPLFRNAASPKGLAPPPPNAQNSSETQGLVTVNLLNDTFRQVNTSRSSGVGGKIDMLG